ncbi:MAG: hypothetical protein ACRDQA_04760, partial [Nocardioidaceae bacterium]
AGTVAISSVTRQPPTIHRHICGYVDNACRGSRRKNLMNNAPGDACTLPTTEQPLRIAEFNYLFSAALQEVQRVSPTRLRLDLNAAAEATAEGLAAHETDCCSFFTFTLTQSGEDTVSMDVEVPPGREDVLDGLATQASAAKGSVADA